MHPAIWKIEQDRKAAERYHELAAIVARAVSPWEPSKKVVQLKRGKK